MGRFALGIGLLLFSAYLWPTLYKRSWNVGSFLIFVAIGFAAVVLLCWLTPRIEAARSTRLPIARLAPLALLSLPAATLQVALGVTYWSYVAGSRFDLGALGALPLFAFVAWLLVDASLRGWCEEVVFRGMLQPALVRRYESYAGALGIAIAITTFWFLVAHLYGLASWRLLPYLAFLSLCYGYLAGRTGRFLSSALVHVMHNAVAGLVAYLGVRWQLGLGSMLGLVAANVVAFRLLAKRWINASTETRKT